MGVREGKEGGKKLTLYAVFHGSLSEARGTPLTKLACHDSTPKIEAAAAKYAYVK